MENKVEIKIIAKDLASKTIKGVGASVSGLASKLSSVARSIGSKVTEGFAQLRIAALATGAAVGFMAYNLGKSAIQSTADIEMMRQGFVTLLGSTKKADKAIERIKKDAAKTPFEIKGLIQANQLLTSVTKDADRSEDFLLNIGKALSAMGRGQPELDRIIVNLQQIGAVGKASTLDLKQFAFAGIPIFEMLQQETGLAGDALEDFITDGKVSFDMLEEMFAKAGTGSGQFAKAFETQTGTLNQLVSNAKDNLVILGVELLTQTGAFDAIKNAVDRFTTFLTNNKGAIVAFVKDGIENLKTKIVELDQKWKIQEKIEQFINFVRKNQSELVTFAKNFGLVTIAITALSVAVGVITSPLLIIIGIIALVSAALTVWQKDIGGVKTKTVDAINKVKGVFTQLMQNPAVQWFVNKVRELSNQIRSNLKLQINELRNAFYKLSPELIKAWNNAKPVLAIMAKVAAVVGGTLVLGLFKFASVMTGATANAIRVVANVLAGALRMFNAISGAVSNAAYWVGVLAYKLRTIRIPNLSAISSVLGRNATGTSFFGGGLTMVGERGPELVQLPRGSRINSASETRNMQGSGQVTNNFNINGYNKDPRQLAQEIAKLMARDNQAQSLGLNLGY